MNETLALLLAWVAGVLLGVIFFGSLWWTVRRGLSSKRPALWFLSSLLLRTSIGRILCGRERSLGPAAGESARLCGRPLHRDTALRPLIEHHTAPAQEAGHAP